MRSLLLGIVLVSACGSVGAKERGISDVSTVEAYFVRCDASVLAKDCHSATHRGAVENFTVIISQQRIIGSTVFPFRGCAVKTAQEWSCLTSKGEPAWMSGGILRYGDDSAAVLIPVSLNEFCESPSSGGGQKPGWWDRRRCEW
jgi:hypothetical protein